MRQVQLLRRLHLQTTSRRMAEVLEVMFLNTGNITVTGTVDGRNVATDGTKLDGIEAAPPVIRLLVKSSYSMKATVTLTPSRMPFRLS